MGGQSRPVLPVSRGWRQLPQASTNIASSPTQTQIKIIGILIFLSALFLAATMASRRALQIGGATLAVGGVYYLYSAGGNPKVAEKKLERARRETSTKEPTNMPCQMMSVPLVPG